MVRQACFDTQIRHGGGLRWIVGRQVDMFVAFITGMEEKVYWQTGMFCTLISDMEVRM